MTRSKSTAPSFEDVQAAMKAIEDDLGLSGRWRFVSGPGKMITAIVEVYREIEGERIGIAREEKQFYHQHAHHIGVLIGCIHRAYWRAEEAAHASLNPYRVKRAK